MTESLASEHTVTNWELHPHYEDLRAAFELQLQQKAVDVVKDSAVRLVYRFKVGGNIFYVKSYKQATRLDKARYLIAPSKGRQEWQNLQKAYAAGLAVPEPVGYYEDKHSTLPYDNYLITRAIEDSQEFLGYLESKYDCYAGLGDLQEKRSIINSLAELIASLYRNAIIHNDLHPRNILYQSAAKKFHIVDWADITFLQSMSEQDFFKQLARFSGYFMLYASRLDRCFFLRVFMRAAKIDNSRYKELQRQLEQDAENWNLQFWQKRRQRVFVVNKDYRQIQESKFKGFCSRAAGFEDDVTVQLDELLLSTEVIKEGRATKLLQVSYQPNDKRPAVSAVLKIYKPKKKINLLKDLFRKSRAAKCWQASLDFQLRRHNCPEALLYVDQHKGGLLQNNMFLSVDIAPAKTIYSYFNNTFTGGVADKVAKQHFIRCFANEMARMHRRGLYHGDLKGDNIYVRQDGRVTRFIFIDLDAVTARSGLSERLALRDVSRLNCEFCKWASRQDRLRFLRQYLIGRSISLTKCRDWLTKIAVNSTDIKKKA